MESDKDLALLADRIANARILREHHVWAAAKVLSLDAGRASSGRRFAALMDAEALLDAVLLLVSRAEPARSVDAIINDEGRWICSMRSDPPQPARRFKAGHADLAAAVLCSLLMSFQASGRRRAPDVGQFRSLNRSFSP